MKYAILYHPRTYHEKNYRYYYVPYSIISIATTLDELIPCLLIDNNVMRCEDPAKLKLPEPSKWACVWISAMIGMQIIDGLRFSRYIKSQRPDCPVIWGGACPTMLPELVANEADIDYLVLGQGEITAKELWAAYCAGEPVTDVPGVAISKDGDFVRALSRPIIDLNDLPPYRNFYSRIGIKQYIRPDEHIGERTVNYHSSQGCPFHCRVCCEPALWSNHWTSLNSQRIIADIEPLLYDYDVNGIKFYDSEFFSEKNRVLSFAHNILERRLHIRWGASSHPKNLLRFSEAELQILRKSGMSRLLLGAETGNESELRLINKKIDKKTMLQVGRLCANLKVSACFTFVTGFPGSPPSHIDKTLEFAEELSKLSSLHEAKVHFYGPYPGTPLYPVALAAGFRPPSTLVDWALYDYYNVNTPWVPEIYFKKVRTFNENKYPYLLGE